MQEDYYAALAECAERYRSMLVPIVVSGTLPNPRNEELLDFINTFKESIQDRLPLLKLNRWLGYIQGCLIERGLTTVNVERDWTRPLFRPLDFKED